MSICQSGIDNKIKNTTTVLIEVTDKHPLIQLSQALPWRELTELILPDLKKTKTGAWWLGRKLKVRIHLAVYLLQHIFNKTDRAIEYDVKDNAAYQVFCGIGTVENWHTPDHTKIEKFRSRLSKETQQALANHMATHAVKLGFADCSDVDIDSTVQEANMTYPADSSLLKKLGAMASKLGTYFNKTLTECIVDPVSVNMKKISSTAREYFFLPKNSTQEIKTTKLTSLLNVVKEETQRIIHICESISEQTIKDMKWNYARTIHQIKGTANQYLQDVKSFLETGCMVAAKRLSFHLKNVACFTKGKLGKKYQFGRYFQLGRIAGNFFFVIPCETVYMPDKTSITSIIQEHERIFDKTKINSVATDKGYFSKENEKLLITKNVNEIGIQRPCNIKTPLAKPITEKRVEELINRRSGIEPLIGHIKHGGQLGRSRMKSDNTIEASGYASVLGFNIRQLIRRQKMVTAEEKAA